jgi:integrase
MRQLIMIQQHGGDVQELIGAWKQSHGPTTVVTYTATLKTLMRETRPRDLQVHTEISSALRGARKSVNRCQVVQARPATAEDMANLRSNLHPNDWYTVALLFVTASRHADLAAMRPVKWPLHNDLHPILQLMMASSFKSDIFAERCLSKWIQGSPDILLKWYRMLHNRSWTPYWRLYRALVQRGDLTVHSFRRGAATILASEGFSMSEIGKLTLHTPKTDEHLSVRRYVKEHPSQAEAQLVMRMSSRLLHLIQ